MHFVTFLTGITGLYIWYDAQYMLSNYILNEVSHEEYPVISPLRTNLANG